MNTDNANKYLDSLQISERSVYDRKDIEHPLDCLLEDYHQEQLKLLRLGVVSNFVRKELERRVDLILSEPDGIVRETMIKNIPLDL